MNTNKYIWETRRNNSTTSRFRPNVSYFSIFTINIFCASYNGIWTMYGAIINISHKGNLLTVSLDY